MSEELEQNFGIIDFENDDDRGANILPEFLKHSENAPSFINTIMPEIQQLHDVQSDVYSTINIYEAVGSQLDDIFGEILDTPREGSQSDDDYRILLLSIGPSLTGSGTIIVVKSVLRNLSGSNDVSLLEVTPHTIILHIFVDDFSDINDKSLVDSTMQDVKAGGINMEIGGQLNGNAFIFSEDVAGGAIGEGFSEEEIFSLITESGDSFISESGDSFISEGLGLEGGTFARITLDSTSLITESGDSFISESGDTFILEAVY